MRNVAKTTTLESKFPLLAVENKGVLYKEADITACFEVRLPEVVTCHEDNKFRKQFTRLGHQRLPKTRLSQILWFDI